MNGQVYSPRDQARLVEELAGTYMKQLCEKKTMDTIRPYVSGVNTEQLDRLQRDYFYDEKVMRGIRCTMGALTLPTRRGIHASHRTMRILNRVKTLASGANGTAALLGSHEDTPLGLVSVSPGGNFVESKENPNGIIGKMSIREGYELKREFIVGSVLNSLRDYGIPHFAQVYGFLQCGSAFDDDMVCLHPGTNPLLLMEKIHGESMNDWIVEHEERSTMDVILVLVQIMSALFVANRWFGFTHNDLHTDNVMIRTLSSPVYVPIRVDHKIVLLKTRYIPVLIDFGYSRITLNIKENITDRLNLHVDPRHRTQKGFHRVALGTDLFSKSNDEMTFESYKPTSTITPYSKYLISDYYRLISILYIDFKHIAKLREILEYFFFRKLKGYHIKGRYKKLDEIGFYLSQDESHPLDNYAPQFLRNFVQQIERTSNRVVRTSKRLDPNVPILACSENLVKQMQSDPNWNRANLTGSCFTEDVFQEENLHVSPTDGAMPDNLPLLVDAVSHRRVSLEEYGDVTKKAMEKSFQYINLPQWIEFLDSTISSMEKIRDEYDEEKPDTFDQKFWETQMKKILHLYVLAYREYSNRVFHLYILNKLEHRHVKDPRKISTGHTLEDYRQIDAVINEDVEFKHWEMGFIIRDLLKYHKGDYNKYLAYSDRIESMEEERRQLRSSKYFKLT